MRRSTVFLLCFVFLQGVVNARAAAPTREVYSVLDDLERSMAQVKTIKTDFIQKKNLALFDRTIVLKGKIFIQKPGMLSWRVFSPMRYSMVIKGAVIKQWDEDTNQVQQISLAGNPSFQAAIGQMQNWFSGAFKSMENDYTITLSADHPLTLEFVPHENAISRNFIKRVTVIFQDDERYVKELRIDENNGDNTVLSFENSSLNQPVEANAWEVRADVR